MLVVARFTRAIRLTNGLIRITRRQKTPSVSDGASLPLTVTDKIGRQLSRCNIKCPVGNVVPKEVCRARASRWPQLGGRPFRGPIVGRDTLAIGVVEFGGVVGPIARTSLQHRLEIGRAHV